MMRVCLFCLCCYACLASAADQYHFPNPQQQQRFKQLTQQLRCLVCQNESLADSNAPLANDLRADIYHMILQGQSTVKIKHYLVARYGEFVLYQPPLELSTLLLWLGPFAFLIIGLLMLGLLLRNTSKNRSTVELSMDEKQRLQELLNDA